MQGDNMNIINIGFTSINANKSATPKGGVSITNNIKMDSIEEVKMGLDQTRQAFKVIFSFNTKYNPNFAAIDIKGEVLVIGTADEAKLIISQWNKDKKIAPEAARAILNNIMNRCSLEVILLSKELGLPSPIPLPSIKAEGVAQKGAAPQKEVKADAKADAKVDAKADAKKKK